MANGDRLMDIIERVEAWTAQARIKLHNGELSVTDLDELVIGVRTGSQRRRQRLLYLHAQTPSIRSRVIGMALHEPVPGSVTQVGSNVAWPYETVHDAICDGWQVIHFPHQQAPYDDREMDILGFEFILQKVEVYDE
jgi:hypothetical protein